MVDPAGTPFLLFSTSVGLMSESQLPTNLECLLRRSPLSRHWASTLHLASRPRRHERRPLSSSFRPWQRDTAYAHLREADMII